MNRLILSISFLLSACAADAQCDLYSKKDDFTGKVVHWTKPVKVASDGAGILAGRFDCKFKVFMHFVCSDGKTALVLTEKGDLCGGCAPTRVTLKLEKGAVLTKSNLQQGRERSQMDGESEQSSIFVLTREEMALLASQEIVNLRLKEDGCTDHPVIEREMPAKTVRQVRESAACIQENAR